MMKRKPEAPPTKRQLGLWVDSAVIKRLDRLLEHYPATKRTSLAREALLRGLKELEAEARS